MNPKPGDSVTIKWPGDVITVRWPDDQPAIQPGQTFRLRTDSLLQVVEAVAVAMAVPEQRKHKGTACNRCGHTVYFVRSHNTGKWYTIDDPGDRRSFHSKTCAGSAKAVV